MPRPLRVLGLGNAYPPHHLGGYEIIWQGVTRRLIAEGHHARVLTTTLRRPGVNAVEEPEVFRQLDWYWHEHEWRRLGLRARLALERHNAAVFDHHVHEFRPDVLAWWPMGGMSLSLLERGRRAGLPAAQFVLDPWLQYGPRHDLWLRTWRRLAPLAPLIERRTGLPTRLHPAELGRWVFCSDSLRRTTLAAVRGLRDTTVLRPGVGRMFLEVAPEAAPPTWRWRLLYVGRVVPQKGVHAAIRALATLPPEATLTVVGEADAAYVAELQALSTKLGLSQRVRFSAPVDPERLPGVYREADAVVFPVEWDEPWGLVPLEAMALGRPVLATGRGGSAEYLRDGDNVLLFPSGDHTSLADAARRLASDPALRERLRAGGRRTAEANGEDAFNAAALDELVAAARHRAPG